MAGTLCKLITFLFFSAATSGVTGGKSDVTAGKSGVTAGKSGITAVKSGVTALPQVALLQGKVA